MDGYQPVDVESERLEDDRLLRFDEHSCPLYDKLVTRNTVSQTILLFYCDDQSFHGLVKFSSKTNFHDKMFVVKLPVML